MSQFQFKLPDIGEGIAEAEIAQWRVKQGDTVAEDQPLVDMLTEKAAVELPSPVAGKIIKLNGNAGDKAAIGSVLVVIETLGAAPSSGASRHLLPEGEGKILASPSGRGRAEGAGEGVATLGTHSEQSTLKPMASPATRRRAREQGIDLGQVPGSGPGGRILADDLARLAESPAGGAMKPEMARRDGVEEIKIIGLRRKIAEAMQRSKQRIPHFAYVEEMDVTELESLRAHLNGTRKPDQAKLTLLPFLMRALVKALPEFPQVNARFDDEAGVVQRHRAVHMGIATQTPNGLVVPVVRHAETLDLWRSAAEVKRLAEAARTGKATREELSGSTITITSLGTMGGIASTPIINAPEVAIVGVNRIIERPVVFNGQIAVRKCMNLSSSFDHRVVDGWDAAAFIQRVRSLLEHPATLFMP
jgi:2-oxoisovalerate dehydrogenase E2 component (dihydrolipoyl transacylase)